MKLFDLIDKLFRLKPSEFQKLDDYEIREHAFMVIRFMAIRYPIHANKLNAIEMDPAIIIKSWNIILWRMYHGGKPNWVYTKAESAPKKKAVKKKGIKYSDQAIAYYAELMCIPKREVYNTIKFYPEEMEKTLTNIEKCLNN